MSLSPNEESALRNEISSLRSKVQELERKKHDEQIRYLKQLEELRNTQDEFARKTRTVREFLKALQAVQNLAITGDL